MYIRFIKNQFFLSFKEKHFGKLKYIFEQNGSDELVIVFPGFGPVPKYNYMRTFSKSRIDKLFLLDNFGYLGSYFWYENGKENPKLLVIELLQKILSGGGIIRYIQQAVAKVVHVPFIMDYS